MSETNVTTCGLSIYNWRLILCQTKTVDGKEKPRCVIAEFPKMEIWQLGWKEQTKQNDVMRFHEFSMKAVSVTVQTKRPRFRKQKSQVKVAGQKTTGRV